MLKKIIGIAGFPDLLAEARTVAETTQRQTALSARTRLMSWLPPSLARCKSPSQALELLNTVSASGDRIHRACILELMTVDPAAIPARLILQHARSMAKFLRDAYFHSLHRDLFLLQKNGQLPFMLESVEQYLRWHCNAFVLDHVNASVGSGCDWHKIYSTYAPVKRSLRRAQGCGGSLGLDALSRRLDNSMTRLLLHARSLNRTLSPRQIIIAAHLVERIHPLVRLADEYSRETPYGTDIHANDPPTHIDGDKPLRADLMLFFGLDGALNELDRLERLLLSQPGSAEDVMIDASQGPVETLAVIKLLRSRWSGRRYQRKSDRKLMQRSIPLVHTPETIRLFLAGKTSPGLGADDGETMCGELVDMSTTGCGIALEHSSEWAKPGALVAFFPPESQRWAVAAVRRLIRKPRNKMVLGVELLALEPVPVRLSETGRTTAGNGLSQPGRSGATPAIYLPPSPLSDDQAGLLTDARLLNEGDVYRASGYGETMYLRIKAVTELGADYIRYACAHV